MPNLLLKGGRVIDPAQKLDRTVDVHFMGGRVAAIGPDLAAGPGIPVRDVAGFLVVPGLIDLHSHVYWGGTSMGVEVEPVARRSGTTTFVDAGSAGPGHVFG